MAKDKVEERKEAKPIKLFTINASVWDDGVMSANMIEYRELGRLKNQKCIVPDGDDFVSCVRSLVPSAVPVIEDLVKTIAKDLEVTETEECEKIGKVVVDIYNDGFVDVDLMETVKGARGAPKNWRLSANDFFDAMDTRVGDLKEVFKPLLKGGYTAPVQLDTVPDDEDIDQQNGYVGEVEYDEEEDQ